MAKLTQRFANVYPGWSKLRMDPSSRGQRFFSCFADTFDDLQAEKYAMSKMFKLVAERLELANIYWVDLEEEDFFQQDGYNSYTFPAVTGYLADGRVVNVVRVEDTSDIFVSAPSRVDLSHSQQIKPIVWQSSSPLSYEEIVIPCRLGVSVYNSTHYKNMGKDRGFPGFHIVQITGLDENRKKIIETVYIRDDGSYRTMHIFSEVEKITYDGFDGDVIVFVEEMYSLFVPDMFHTGVSKEREGLTHVRGFEEPGGNVGLEFYLKKFADGRDYRLEKLPDTFEQEDIEENIDYQMMRDSDGVLYSVVDYTVSPEDGKIWCLSSDGRVHVHRNSPLEFQKLEEDEGTDTTIELIPEIHRVPFNEELYIWTFFRAMNGLVKEFGIRRLKPDGTIEYLQSDKTWDPAEHKFPGRYEQASLPEDSHDTLRFSSEIDALGEWHFYCDATVFANASVALTETSRIGVMCGYNDALATYETGLTNVAKIYFSKENWLTVVTDLSSTAATENYFTLHRDVYMADTFNNRILVREDYEELEVESV